MGLKGLFPRELTIKLSGRSWTFSELRMEDFTAAEDWLCSESINTILECNLPTEEQYATIEKLIQSDSEFDELIQKSEVQHFLVYRSILRRHPGLEYETWFAELDSSVLSILSKVVYQISGLIGTDKSDPAFDLYAVKHINPNVAEVLSGWKGMLMYLCNECNLTQQEAGQLTFNQFIDRWKALCELRKQEANAMKGN